MRHLVALALLAGLAAAAPVPKALKKQDTASLLVGTWKPDNGKGSEWFAFDAEGGMKAWSNGGNANNPSLYTYTVDPDPDGSWRMIWMSKGQTKPSFQAVFVIDGDRMYMSYSGASDGKAAKPDPSAPSSMPNFTRQPTGK